MSNISNALHDLSSFGASLSRHRRITATMVLRKHTQEGIETLAALLNAYLDACNSEKTTLINPELIARAGKLLQDFGESGSALNLIQFSTEHELEVAMEATYKKSTATGEVIGTQSRDDHRLAVD